MQVVDTSTIGRGFGDLVGLNLGTKKILPDKKPQLIGGALGHVWLGSWRTEFLPGGNYGRLFSSLLSRPMENLRLQNDLVPGEY